MGSKTQRTRLVDRVLGASIAGYIDLVDRTSQQPPLMDRYAVSLAAEHPMIIAMWHGQFMLLPTLTRMGFPTKAMLALHQDAEGLAVALARYGIELIRGAGASAKGKDRGGARAFRGAAEALEQGYSVAMTADVPPGPARRAGHGIVTLAKVTGRPILPVAMCSSRYIALPTWSRMTINLPGSQLGASFGATIHVPSDASADDLERLRQDVEIQMNIATADAYNRAGVSAMRATPPRALAMAGLRMPPGSTLKLYVQGTRAFEMFAPRFLDMRQRKGKEDQSRRSERLGIAAIKRPEGEVIWLHAASVGETVSILPLIALLVEARPGVTVLLTTGTVTSALLAGQKLPPRTIHQFVPLDVPHYVTRFIEHWSPDLAAFVESEIWPNIILGLAGRDIPIALVNARLSKASFRRWRRQRGVSIALFSRFNSVMAQTREFADRFAGLGAPNVVVTGNLKFDAPAPQADLRALERYKAELGGRPVFVAASTHEEEELIVAQAHRLLQEWQQDTVTVIVPRHPERGPAILEKLRSKGFDATLKSQTPDFDMGSLRSGLLVADTLGELGTWFALAKVAFIGKSLSREGGGHNPIEAIRHGGVVLTGPDWSNFDQVYRALFAAKAAIQVEDAAAMAREVATAFDDPQATDQMRLRASRVCDGLSGALQKTLNALMAMLPQAPEMLSKTD